MRTDQNGQFFNSKMSFAKWCVVRCFIYKMLNDGELFGFEILILSVKFTTSFTMTRRHHFCRIRYKVRLKTLENARYTCPKKVFP